MGKIHGHFRKGKISGGTGCRSPRGIKESRFEHLKENKDRLLYNGGA